MRYYFAGAYARRAELAEYASDLCLVPSAFVVSSWLDGSQADDDNDTGFSDLTDPRIVELAWKYGHRDLADLSNADAIVSFTGEGARGGRHIEHGYAISRMELDDPREMRLERLIIVGPREHVFHCHPATEVFEDFDAFLAHEVDREESK